MGIVENKQLVNDFFAHFNAGDLAKAMEMMADDATWWIAGKPELLPVAGNHTKQEIVGILQSLIGQLKSALKLTVKGLVAEGDQVALEAESYGELQNGRIYNPQYHFLITIHAGKISAIKEYIDTQHVFATWFQQ